MFYIKEFLYRCQYIFFSFFFTIILCYEYRTELTFLFTQSILSYNLEPKASMINHFIYTHPVELFSVQVLLMLYFSLLFHFPFLFWQIIDFFKSSLTAFEYSRIYILIIIVFSFLFMINTITCFYLFPSIWLFFVNFNHMSKFFLELRIQEYFFFVKDFIYLLNESILFSIFLFTFFVFNGFHVLLRWKKLFIFLIMMFSTFLSPPEICSQLLLFFFFMFFFELIVLVYIIIVKFYKYIIISKVIY